MQWKTIATGLGNTAIGLWSNGRKMLTLNFRGQSDWVYLQSEEGEKRYFRYKQKGLLKNKIALENEYGTDLVKIKKEAGREYISINGTRYSIEHRSNNQVAIIPEGSNEPLAVCSMEVGEASVKTSNSLLLVLGLYLFGNPAYKEEPVLAY